MTKDLAPRSVFREGGKFLRKERREQYAGENNKEVLAYGLQQAGEEYQ